LPIKPFKEYFLDHITRKSHSFGDHDFFPQQRGNDQFKHWFTHPKTGHHIKLGSGHDEEGTLHTMVRAIHPETGKTHIQVHGQLKNGHFTVHGLSGNENSTIKAHQMYHGMLRHGKLKSLTSDDQQSMGGAKTWAKLSQYNDLKVKHKGNFYGVKYRKRLHPPKSDGSFGRNYTGPSRFEAKPIKSKLHYAVRLLRKKRFPVDALKK
jgi:hypothetical protein